MSDDLQDKLIPDPISDEERLREAETEALCLQITKEDPGYLDRLADRIIAEAEGGSITMEELLGLPPADDGQIMSMDEERPDEDKDFEERLQKVEENMRVRWPELRDSQIAALMHSLRQMRGPEWDE
jgi:hypothetical protein